MADLELYKPFRCWSDCTIIILMLYLKHVHVILGEKVSTGICAVTDKLCFTDRPIRCNDRRISCKRPSSFYGQ